MVILLFMRKKICYWWFFIREVLIQWHAYRKLFHGSLNWIHSVMRCTRKVILNFSNLGKILEMCPVNATPFIIYLVIPVICVSKTFLLYRKGINLMNFVFIIHVQYIRSILLTDFLWVFTVKKDCWEEKKGKGNKIRAQGCFECRHL